jgi:hypothetical protein
MGEEPPFLTWSRQHNSDNSCRSVLNQQGIR